MQLMRYKQIRYVNGSVTFENTFSNRRIPTSLIFLLYELIFLYFCYGNKGIVLSIVSCIVAA